jgi:pentapeptide MXKDX repeat protein
MKRILGGLSLGLAALVVVLVLILGTSGCGSTPSTGGDKMGDKMKGDKMGDKMKADKMDGDKMDGDKK